MQDGTARHGASPVRLADYRPPDYLVDRISLDIDLADDGATVQASMTGRRNPAAGPGPGDLRLDGRRQELLSVTLDGDRLDPSAYRLDDNSLVIPVTDDRFSLAITSRNQPRNNTELEGLYLSNGIYCTQCEAEGFRKITFFPDRPDVLTTYTTTIRADRQRYPVLLSNGNPVETGDAGSGRHYATWYDPFPKPSYLFAMVAGQLTCVEDHFVTRSGRRVTLQIYVEPGEEGRCSYAMNALKRAMAWDEERFGLEYDLDLFMIVAISQFNAGAMENKGLNIFNSRYVLADPDTATDTDFERIEEIVAHEYFHNWTGNRVTCRDWFQLSLKEGLTVFRHQEFMADMHSRAARRVADARLIRAIQFPEDAGPTAHPVRPEEYLEINNFYTITVYEKGAELVRMLHTVLGDAGFAGGLRLYLQRHDGEAATCEDFLAALAEANGVDLSEFMIWYQQAGTPKLTVTLEHDPDLALATMRVSQTLGPSPGQATKRPMPIPFALGLLDREGRELPLRLAGETGNEAPDSRVLVARDATQTFTFENVATPPVPSLLRGFSAPVRIRAQRSRDDLLLLLTHDSDAYARWEAGKAIAMQVLHELVDAFRAERPMVLDPDFVAALRAIVSDPGIEPEMRAMMLELPDRNEVAIDRVPADFDAIDAACRFAVTEIGRQLLDDLEAVYETGVHRQDESDISTSAAGLRRLANCALYYLAAGDQAGIDRAKRQFDTARSMTQTMGALMALNDIDCPERAEALESFHARWYDRPMQLDKWFALKAASCLPETTHVMPELLRHPLFDLEVPNRVWAVAGTFVSRNPVRFNAADGSGYRLVADLTLDLDRVNPQIAARLLKSLVRWQLLDEHGRGLLIAEMKRIAATTGLSPNCTEIIELGLAGVNQA